MLNFNTEIVQNTKFVPLY